MAEIMKSGPYDLGSGDTELARVFSWRFWHLLRDGGRFGVVLPRQAILAAPGMKKWRVEILEQGAFDDVTLLVNNREWVFEAVHAQYTVGLVTVAKGGVANHVVLSGPFRSMSDYDQREAVELNTDEFRSWSDSLLFPMLASSSDVEIYRHMLRHPRIGSTRTDWTFRPVRELETEEKHLYTTKKARPDMWPVYTGGSLDIWQPDTGEYYAWTDPAMITEHLYKKRIRQRQLARSAFYQLPLEVAKDRNTLACLAPRLALRDVARATDRRTLRAALIPPHVIPQEKAPYLMRFKGDQMDEAYLLGILSSRILDWVARRVVEAGMKFGVINLLPVPQVSPEHPGRARVIQLAGRLAAVDERYAEWAKAVGVGHGPIADAQADDMKTEIDACVARLYGLDEQQIRDLYATFHPTWDHEPWTERVLEHYSKITWDPAEVPA